MKEKFAGMADRLSNFQESLPKEGNVSVGDDRFTQIPLAELRTAPWNARRYLASNSIEKLSKDFMEQGQLHPIVVRPKDGAYEIVVGERRFRAAQQLGWRKIKAEIRELSDKEAQRASLAENLSRENLNVFEETIGHLRLLILELSEMEQFVAFREPAEPPENTAIRILQRYAYEAERAQNNVILNDPQVQGTPLEAAIMAVFASAGRMTWQSFVKNRLPVLSLPEDVMKELREGHLEYTKAKKIAQLKDDTVRQTLLKYTLEENLPLTKISARVRAAKTTKEDEPIQLEVLSKRAQVVSKTIKKSSVLTNKVKLKKAERLLVELEGLLGIGQKTDLVEP